MNKASHIMLSRYLASGKLQKYVFWISLGSIMPDLLVHTFVVGHKYDETLPDIEKMMKELEEEGKWDVRSCFKMGYILHYLEDYFTHPHNNNFFGNIYEHCRYEAKLQRSMEEVLEERKIRLKMTWNTTSEMSSWIREKHFSYMAHNVGPENDACYILEVAERVCAFYEVRFEEKEYQLLRQTGYILNRMCLHLYKFRWCHGFFRQWKKCMCCGLQKQ